MYVSSIGQRLAFIWGILSNTEDLVIYDMDLFLIVLSESQGHTLDMWL
jgi:hypothetical protein